LFDPRTGGHFVLLLLLLLRAIYMYVKYVSVYIICNYYSKLESSCNCLYKKKKILIFKKKCNLIKQGYQLHHFYSTNKNQGCQVTFLILDCFTKAKLHSAHTLRQKPVSLVNRKPVLSQNRGLIRVYYSLSIFMYSLLLLLSVE